ncbi:MAG: tetratricopeptide repeat protein, partial [Pirellulaceae bacterium]
MLDWRRALYFALWCGTALTQLAEAWFHTRPVIWLVEGIPALLGAVAFVAVTISFGATSRIDVVDRYDLAIDEAIQRSDFVAAELYLHKLLQIGDSQENVRYRLALVADEQGDGARANEMMAQIAPETGRGHPGAHFWRAKHMLSKRQPLTLTESRQLVSHLEASLSDAADNVEAHSLLGQILFSQRNFDGAIEHLTTLIKEEPQWRITLAKVYLAQGNRSEFEKELTAACSEFQRRVHNRADDMEARLWLAQAWALRGKFDEAEKALLECIQLPGVDGKRCRDGLASLYVAQFDRDLPQAPPQNPPVEWLRKSLDQSPNYIDALLRLANYMNASGEAGKAARSAINKVLASDDVPPALLQILGAHAARDGDMAAARGYLERALAVT